MAAPAAAADVAASVVTKPLASTQAAAAEVAAFWLGDGGANLANATPYTVRASVSEPLAGAVITPSGKPGSIAPSLPSVSRPAQPDGPATSGKVFFIGADGQPHWCTGSAVHSQYRNVVATAAQCAFDTQTPGAALGKWVFVPRYAAGAAPLGLYVGKQLFGHQDFDTGRDFDRGYAFVNVYEGVVPSATGEPTGYGRLGDNVGGQGLAWNQPLDYSVNVFGYPAGPHPDGVRPYTGQNLKMSVGSVTTTAHAPSLKGERLLPVRSWFTGYGAQGSSWLLNYDAAGARGYLNGLTLSVTDTDANLRYDTALSPYFDDELLAVYSAADAVWTGAVSPG
ncbi:hypothetical protein [Nonomuraea sp. NPDC049480]|uniref:hypothetical protein n=1 Tax=Nonomuraea sp. NPDC049480 TaxID=3364353 RepID=UPI00379ADECA